MTLSRGLHGLLLVVSVGMMGCASELEEVVSSEELGVEASGSGSGSGSSAAQDMCPCPLRDGSCKDVKCWDMTRKVNYWWGAVIKPHVFTGCLGSGPVGKHHPSKRSGAVLEDLWAGHPGGIPDSSTWWDYSLSTGVWSDNSMGYVKVGAEQGCFDPAKLTTAVTAADQYMTNKCIYYRLESNGTISKVYYPDEDTYYWNHPNELSSECYCYPWQSKFKAGR